MVAPTRTTRVAIQDQFPIQENENILIQHSNNIITLQSIGVVAVASAKIDLHL